MNLVSYSPLLVAAIAALATAAPFIYNVYNQAYSNPNVHLLVTPNFKDDGRKALVTISNSGGGPAENFSIIIEMPKKILTVTPLLGNGEILLPALANKRLIMHVPQLINQTNLSLYIPRLNKGDGSVLALETTIVASPKERFSNYTSMGIYDQGSVRGTIEDYRGDMSILEFADSWKFNSYIWLIAIVYAAGGGYLIYLTYHKRKKRFINEIKENILEVRRKLRGNINNNEEIPNEWLRAPNKSKARFKDVEDYMRIDDFYQRLDERNRNLNHRDIQYLNLKCVRLAEQAIEIDWKKCASVFK